MSSLITKAARRFGFSGGHQSTPATWVPPGHFYSPLVDPTDPRVTAILDGHPQSELEPDCGLKLDDRLILETLDRISAFYCDLPFPDDKDPRYRYYYKNNAFEYGDACTYFGMMRDLKPRRIVEVGSGFSSALAVDTNELFFDGAVDLTFIEPYPDTFNALLGSNSPYARKLLELPVQDVPVDVFQVLRPSDILFIDSSHVAKLGSDVNDYMFRILPKLARGVVVHIHDIPYPFEYDAKWITGENRSWNEAYLLRAFLQFNPAFRVIYFNHYVYRKFPKLLAEKMPMCLLNCGASIWLEKLQ